MDKEKLLQIATRRLRKAEQALANNYDRKGITEKELEDLSDNVRYEKIVYGLIVEHIK